MLASLLIAAVAAAGSSDSAIASRTQIPTPAAEIVAAPCPDGGRECADPAQRRVYLPAGSTAFTRQHGLGHLFDAQFLDAGERNKFKRLFGFKLTDPWFNGTGDTREGLESPNEWLADAYAACRLRMDPRGAWTVAYGYLPTPRQHREVCATIRRAALDRA